MWPKVRNEPRSHKHGGPKFFPQWKPIRNLDGIDAGSIFYADDYFLFWNIIDFIHLCNLLYDACLSVNILPGGSVENIMSIINNAPDNKIP